MAASPPILSSLNSISALKTQPNHHISYSPIPNPNPNPNPNVWLVYKAPNLLINRNTARSIGVGVVNADITSTIIVSTADPDITWQILIGALAGVIPFVIAGIEFSKRIVEQRNCKVCKGSGLVLRDAKYYFRCPRCGGFLPWQSWRRFFTG